MFLMLHKNTLVYSHIFKNNESSFLSTDSRATQRRTMMTQEQREALINYCYQHEDRPNPIQDLIDKGFLSPEFKGETCLSVKQAYDKEQIIIETELMIQQQKEDAISNKCIIDTLNPTMTYEECYRIYKGNETR